MTTPQVGDTGDEAARLATLHRYAILDTAPEQAFDDLARLARQLCDTPIALITFVDAERWWVKAKVGLDAGETLRDASFCDETIRRRDLFTVEDLSRDDRYAANPLVCAEPHLRFYAGVPLATPDGHALGALCVLDRRSRRLASEQEEALRAVGHQVMTQLELRRHVTELQRTIVEGAEREARLHLLESVVVNANDAVLITEAEPIDLPGPRILYVNEAFTRMTGYSRDEVMGRTRRLLHGPDTDRAALDTIRKALKRWRPVRVEVLNYRRDGSPFWVELNIVPVANEAGWYTHWVSVQRETGARKAAEEEIRATRTEAERASQAKSEFLSRMSHELRTPLNAILGFAQLLELNAPPAQRKSIGHILKGGWHLLTLINEVLDITRIEAGHMDLSPEPVLVSQVCQEILALIEPLAAERGIRFAGGVGEGCGWHVLADQQRLKQVLLNLLSNAVKYNHAGGTVTLACEEVVGGRLRVGVRDSGPGIAPDKFARLFTPFERLGAEGTGVEGTGLGLALSKRLVEAMRGTIGVDSTVGEGSTFWVEFPLADNPLAGLDGVEEEAPSLAARHGAARTVLYIEDNLSNLSLVEHLLEQRPGIALLTAMQGGFGLHIARARQPDLILLDLNLPDMAGAEVLRLLRDDPCTSAIPVVVISADATPGRIERLLTAGATAYATKPLEVRRFLAILDEALGRGERV